MSTIQVQVDDQMKMDADVLFAHYGMDIATAMRILLQFALNNKELVLLMQQQQEEDEFARLSPETQQAVIDARLRQNLFGPYQSGKAAVAAMLED